MSESHREPPPPLSSGPSREEIDGLVASGDVAAARAGLEQFWRQSPGGATANFVVSRFEKLRSSQAMPRHRVAILRSFTIEPLIPLLRAQAFAGGIDLEIQVGDFNTYLQEILDPSSSIYAFTPDTVILAAHAPDVVPDLWNEFVDLNPAQVGDAIQRSVEHFKHLVTSFRARSRAHLILHNLQVPSEPVSGVLDARLTSGQRQAISAINAELATLARTTQNVYLLDYDALVARRGAMRWEDRRKWISARLPIAAAELIWLAKEWMRFLHPITGKICKAVAVDLDNTLWGGVIGEDGIDGIKLGPDYRGAAWLDVQRALLDLYRRGILLAICSKNNPAEAMEAIAKHPQMLLRPEHFAAVRCNWDDKATNLRNIAKELNIGLDAIAFLDDNPVERDWVRRQVPEITVIDLPTDAMGFAPAIREAAVFERLTLSAEDAERGRYYAEQRLRTELQESTGSIEDFYRSLQMKAEIALVNAQSLLRAAQLTQKTNQFNLTTRRYSEEQMADVLKSPQWQAWTIRVVDRFGDNGIVGLAMTKMDGDVCEIDTFLLSCRVIGRTVETVFLARLADAARERGAKRLAGSFLPTKKNVPSREFYASHGFVRVGEIAADGPSHWTLDLDEKSVAYPQWIELINNRQEHL